MNLRKPYCMQALLVLTALILITACEQMPTRDSDIIGRLERSGPDVRVNGRQATDGMSLRNRDYVETGAGSEALIRFEDGSIVRMDERTDPSFWLEWVSTARCLIHYVINSGRVGGSNGDCEHVVTDPDGNEWIAGSEYVVSRERDTSMFTLLSGRAQMRQPRVINIRPGDRITVRQGSVVEVERLDPREIRRLRSWLRSFESGRPEPEPQNLVPMPALEGRSLNEARRLLGERGFRLGRIQHQLTARRDEGVVIRQSIRPNSRRPRGTSVDVVVSRAGAESPRLIGLDVNDARRGLERAGLRLGRVGREETNTSEPGTVISQSPQPGAVVPRGSSVSVVVAERSVYCTVPDIEGMQLERAQKLLRDAGLRWRVTARYEYDTNRVSRVEPRPGTRIRCTQIVEIQLGVIG